MNWEELTAPEFAAAVKTCGRVCILPIGVIEKHGDHLPLGMDTLHAQHAARGAAELEPCMVFPFYYFGQNTHAKCEPGAIAIRFELLHELLESVCDEIARNGFDKIMILNSHGGNLHMLNYFNEKMLDAEKPYSLYIYSNGTARSGAPCREAAYDGHGGEAETSIMMVLRPELVKGQAADYGLPQPRETAYRERKVQTPSWWYAKHPDMLAADQTPATVEKGRELFRLETERIAEVIRLVKADEEPARLYREFHTRCRAFAPPKR